VAPLGDVVTRGTCEVAIQEWLDRAATRLHDGDQAR
jgi:hypothetical protein